MRIGRNINGWVVTAVLMAAAIVVGGLMIWSRCGRSQPIEILMAPERKLTGDIRVDGEVNNPGLYPLNMEYTIADLVRIAGGVTIDADLNLLTLSVSSQAKPPSPQKVDINRAEAWLLEALPGIGETKARAIVEYRQENGPFRSINEIIQVEGIGDILYEEIKRLITVAD
jgi:competence protein ComEA